MLLSHLAKVTQEKDALEVKYNNIQVILDLSRSTMNLMTKKERESGELLAKS